MPVIECRLDLLSAGPLVPTRRGLGEAIRMLDAPDQITPLSLTLTETLSDRLRVHAAALDELMQSVNGRVDLSHLSLKILTPRRDLCRIVGMVFQRPTDRPVHTFGCEHLVLQAVQNHLVNVIGAEATIVRAGTVSTRAVRPADVVVMNRAGRAALLADTHQPHTDAAPNESG